MYIFQKNLYPTTLEEKLKLTLRGSFCIGEEVQSAAYGSLKVMQGNSFNEDRDVEKEEKGNKIK